MSRIKSYLLGFITLCSTFTAFGQTQVDRPIECDQKKIQDAGYTNGADFSIIPQAGCITNNNRASGAVVSLINVITPTGASLMSGVVKFNFNYTDAAGSITFPQNSSVPSYTYKDPGTYWIVMNGVLPNSPTSYLTCKSVEVIDTHQLDIDYDFCDPLHLKIIIKDTPNNKEQPRILIAWGDGNTKTYDVTSFPHTIEYTYTSVPNTKPKIQGLYVRGGREVCTSDGLNLDIKAIETPKIISLEGLAGGTQNKITVKGGTPDVDFTIEMRPKGGAWTSTGKTIKLASTNGATATETITVPDNSGEYCFRLQRNGMCGASSTSDPVCTIKSSYQVLSPKDVKIDWKSESYVNPPTTSSISRYQIFYRETPTNINQNSVPVNASANPTFTFDQMDC
ncbi:MAG TPA: hypothetical protein VGE24_16405, partial [Emticicia sp.]